MATTERPVRQVVEASALMVRERRKGETRHQPVIEVAQAVLASGAVVLVARPRDALTAALYASARDGLLDLDNVVRIGRLCSQHCRGGLGLGNQDNGILIAGRMDGVDIHCFVSCREEKDSARRNTMGGLGAYVAYPPEATELDEIIAAIIANPAVYQQRVVRAKTMAR